VEREIIQDTLARALVDCGEHLRAARLLGTRLAGRRHHVYEDHLLAPGPNGATRSVAPTARTGSAPTRDRTTAAPANAVRPTTSVPRGDLS